MPDDSGKLTPADQEKFKKWLNDKTKNHSCPVCNSNNWALGEHLLSGMVYSGGNLIVGGPAYPLAFIVCNVCSHTRQFMAVPIGLLPGEGGGNG